MGIALVALLAPAGAQAAEVEVSEPTGVRQQVVVERGKSARFAVDVSASGTVSCFTNRNSGVTARVDTDFAVSSAGQVASSTPSDPLPFYSNRQGVLASCGVTWDGAPTPYRVIATLRAAPDTPPGAYTLPLPASVTNPGVSFLGPLRDDAPRNVQVRVIAPLRPAAEDESVNALPVSGRVFVRRPGGKPELITGPVHLPVDTIFNTLNGHVDLISDGDGDGTPQRAEFWDGRFRVGYTRQLIPGRRGRGRASQRQAKRPFTELRLLGSVPRRCGATGASEGKPVHDSRRRRRKRRRKWGRGRGRYRTRGRRGAATVRGTTWMVQDTCRGTLARVGLEGTVIFRDFGLGRNFRLEAGESYLAAPPGASNSHD